MLTLNSGVITHAYTRLRILTHKSRTHLGFGFILSFWGLTRGSGLYTQHLGISGCNSSFQSHNRTILHTHLARFIHIIRAHAQISFHSSNLYSKSYAYIHKSAEIWGIIVHHFVQQYEFSTPSRKFNSTVRKS